MRQAGLGRGTRHLLCRVLLQDRPSAESAGRLSQSECEQVIVLSEFSGGFRL